MPRWPRNSLFIISDSELKVSRHDTLFLIISSSITGKLENLGSKVFKHSSEIHYITSQR